ncbi:Na+/H+ antiporter subunit D [Desulfuribacillus stibiiarsenatis]|uniref:Na+/H+ antiporter subunit D n=1 Tax=Desulfuribacillus stibiiarsenatis TaxID=1390249 RepID=A0A1E5L384_9FIRM|nr:Na+/H+ antiporter subunit D [Desulfuribacillus stibiiarsenatis]OEH84582.1 Na+/H+ antiporter subunit D [Desulfuribacillus stibiiarsenatis]
MSKIIFTNLALLPIIIPFFTAILLLFFQKRTDIQKVIAGISTVFGLAVSIYVFTKVMNSGIYVFTAGNWAAPFGIVLVADLLSSTLVVLAFVVMSAVMAYSFAMKDHDRESFYYYPLMFFLLVGIVGSFLTGDIFNLFVFFEIMLLSSFILVTHGGTIFQLREGFKYVVLNMLSSTLFLVSVSYLYATIGSLNMADISLRVAEVEQQGILSVIAIMFLIVFAMKAAVFPLFFWLPNAYSGPPHAIAAFFAGLMTKVGVYALFRVFTLIFNHHPEITHNLLFFLGSLSLIIGITGAVSSWDFKKILPFFVVSHIGYMVIGLGMFTTLAIAGAIFYMIHDIIIKAALFLYSGVTKHITGTTDLRKMSGVIRSYPALGWGFFVAMLAVVGVPPLSGFFPKFAILQAGMLEGRYSVAFVVVIVSVLTLYAGVKIFQNVFWGNNSLNEQQKKLNITPMVLPVLYLTAIAVIIGFNAEWFYSLSMMIAEDLMNPHIYIHAVLGGN